MKNKKPYQNVTDTLHHMRVEGLLLLLVCFFSVLSPAFLSMVNLQNLLLQNTHNFVIVAGVALIMIGGGVDLSIGYQLSLVSVTIGMLINLGCPPIAACLAGLATGCLCGLFNGWLVAELHVAPYAATLISRMAFEGISYSLSEGRSFVGSSEAFRVISRGRLLGIHTDIWIALVCVTLVGLIFQYTFWGKYIRAIGEDKQATRRSGVNISRVTILCYITASALYAVAAVILISKQGIASSASGLGLEITAFAAAFIGGVTAYAERNAITHVNVLRLMLGVLICGIIENGIQLIGGSQYIKYLMIAVILICFMIDRRDTDRSGDA